MRFWDSSAIVPLLVDEESSASVRASWERDLDMAVWWATPSECISALARLDREARLDDIAAALERLADLGDTWTEIEPHEALREIGHRLLRTHPLRAADALQLAAAIVAAQGRPRQIPFVTLDSRLALAAQKEGFRVEPLA